MFDYKDNDDYNDPHRPGYRKLVNRITLLSKIILVVTLIISVVTLVLMVSDWVFGAEEVTNTIINSLFKE